MHGGAADGSERLRGTVYLYDQPAADQEVGGTGGTTTGKPRDNPRDNHGTTPGPDRREQQQEEQ